MNHLPASKSYLTIRQYADELARDYYGEDDWHSYRNEPLNQLLPAIWRDEFGEAKKSRSLPNYESPARVLLYRLLPKGDYWIPDGIKYAGEYEFLWEEMAGLHWRDYDPIWLRRIIEQTVLPKSVLEEWRRQYWRKPEPARDGSGLDIEARRKGGSYSKFHKGLQKFINYVRDQLEDKELTRGTLKAWLQVKASDTENPFETDIPDCDEVYFEDDKISWHDAKGIPRQRALKSLDPYIRRAKQP